MNKVIVVTSYPARPCGIATYSHDLINAMISVAHVEFEVCALENGKGNYQYDNKVKHVLDSSNPDEFIGLAEKINKDNSIDLVYVQHEFGLFGGDSGANILLFLYTCHKPVVITFHSVLPNPEPFVRIVVRSIIRVVERVIVMTQNAKQILISDYQVPEDHIEIIPHGVHEILHQDRNVLKEKYNLSGKLVLSTFGLINEGKSIEIALKALPSILDNHSTCVFLVLGQTHPEIVKRDGEKYRNELHRIVLELGIQKHVIFINRYLPLDELLEYLQLTDIYLFTSKDPIQAVSGTFAYALSSGCPIVSTPIPHVKELLTTDFGRIFDFNNSEQLCEAVCELASDPENLENMRMNSLQKIHHSLWQNSALDHLNVFNEVVGETERIVDFVLPKPDITHLKSLTTSKGIMQFAKLSLPDPESGYTLDDNARALIATCMLYQYNSDRQLLKLISIYFNFISRCQIESGKYINYIDRDGGIHIMNHYTNLEDSNGRAIWALGYFISSRPTQFDHLENDAITYIEAFLPWIQHVQSPRAIAFVIKGLYLYNQSVKEERITSLIKILSDKLVHLYNHSSADDWKWFEPYLTYANAVLPEALIFAWMETGNTEYRDIAEITFEFLLSQIFEVDKIRVISNRGWRRKEVAYELYGEQPIDVAYTILALDSFQEAFPYSTRYSEKITKAMAWFYGHNHLNRYLYCTATGGCYDGLEKENVNMNQGAESTVCYLIARCIVEKYEPKPLLEAKQFVQGVK